MIEVGAKSVPMKIGVRRSKAPEAIPSITETKSDPSEPSLRQRGRRLHHH